MEMPRHHASARTLRFLALFLCLGATLRAAGVHLLNGESYDGRVQISDNAFLVVSQSGSTKVEFPQIIDVVFRDDMPAGKGTALPPGVLLTNGTLIAGQIQDITDPLKINSISFPLSSVAWIIFQPIQRGNIVQPSGGRTGVLLPTGDFFPGAIDSIKDDRIAISSAMFGPQRFSIKDRPDISALVLRGVQDGGARYEVLARNGSIYAINNIKIEGEYIVLDDLSFGTVKFGRDDLYEIRLAAGYYQKLAELKPDHVDVPTGVDAANAVQVPQNAGHAPTQNLQAQANVSATYTVPKGFANFSTGAMVSKDAPASARFIFTVYGDGKFPLAKTSPIGRGDNTQHLAAPVANYRTITLRIEPASVDASAGSGQWIMPVFLRQ